MAATLTLLAGCGSAGSGADGPRVASVPAGASATTAGIVPKATTASVVDRQLRLGATQAEIDRAYDAYYACWTAAGIPSTKAGGGNGGPLLTWKLNQKKYQKQVDSCADKEPLDPPELSPETNPQYWDQLRKQLRCVKAKGLPFVIVPGRPGLSLSPLTQANRDKLNSPAGTKAYNECEREAFTQ